MAVPVPRIICCVLNHHNLSYQIQSALAFNWDTCCHPALCLRLLPFHSYVCHSGVVPGLGLIHKYIKNKGFFNSFRPEMIIQSLRFLLSVFSFFLISVSGNIFFFVTFGRANKLVRLSLESHFSLV